MTIEVPRKTAYYKRKQAEHIFISLQFCFFALKSEEFWDFIVLAPNAIKLVKVVSTNETNVVPPAGKEYETHDREIWRFSPFKKMPDIEKIPKSAQ
jgi:hypothetical protein